MKFKALIAGLVAGTIIMAQAGVAFAAADDMFSDVSKSRADYNAITFLANIDLIGGYQDGTFKPDQEVNRAEALKMIMGMDNMNYWQWVDGAIFGGASTDMPFTDLDKTAWYYDYLQRAYNDALVGGYPDGTFKPGQTVNTAEAIKILMNHTFLRIDDISMVKVVDNPFRDAEYNAWYAPYLKYADERGIAVADANGNISPGANITRGMLAQLIYRAYAFDGQTIDKKGITVNLDETAGKYIVKNEGKKVARLDKIGADLGEEEAYIKKVTDKYAYVSVCATGFGGYSWYYFCYGDTYRIDLETGTVEPLNFTEPVTSKKIANFMDVSADETMTAWTDSEDHKIYVALIASDALATFDVDAKYAQFGDVKFSPDGKKLAYAAIVGDPDNEQSAVYTIDIETGEQTLEKEVTKQILNVNGWNTDGTVMYSVVTQN